MIKSRSFHCGEVFSAKTAGKMFCFFRKRQKYRMSWIFEDDKLVSMLFLVDCKYSDLSGKYVYAVCTDEN